MMKPFLAHPGLLISTDEDGYIAYDPNRDRLHRLNPSASLILELCDGVRGLEEIQALVSQLSDSEGGSDSFSVSEWVTQAVEDGLLIDAARTVDALPLSASRMRKLSRRLRKAGEVQIAFLCQQKATELDPGHVGGWFDLGELAHIVGEREKAREAYQNYLRHEPDDAEIRLILTALSNEAPPDRAPDECIQQLYARFAEFYEENMCEDLDYRAPEILANALRLYLRPPADDELTTLDLGCGTGLFGLQLREIQEENHHLTGLDLSREMLGRAWERDIYDELEDTEITEWLASCDQEFHLIAACDCLIYFGDLAQIFSPASRCLAPEGLLAFTVERGGTFPFTLTDSGRYTHHPDHIRQTAEAHGFKVLHLEEASLRMEYGEEVMGLVVITQPALEVVD